MLSHLNQFYESLPEPNRGCFLALRSHILSLDDGISETWKWKVPFFMFKKKGLCYLWKDTKTQQPYIGIVKGKEMDHPMLDQGNRKSMKVLHINASEDLPLELITEIFREALTLYK